MSGIPVIFTNLLLTPMAFTQTTLWPVQTTRNTKSIKDRSLTSHDFNAENDQDIIKGHKTH